MKKSLLILSIFLFAKAATALELSSPEVAAEGKLSNEHVLSGFGCTGKNISPALKWKNVPSGTKSLAITAYDPDAPTGSGWWHWVLFNLPPNVTELPANAGNPETALAPKNSVQSTTDFGKPGFGGACPPAGDKPHRYIFTVYALKLDALPLDKTASGAMVGFFLNANALEKASLTTYYGR